jgi:hypothetical protein
LGQLLFFCNLKHFPHRNNFQLNNAIPERGTIPTPGAASQGCLCNYPAGEGFALSRWPEAKSKKAGAPPAPAFFNFQQVADSRRF